MSRAPNVQAVQKSLSSFSIADAYKRQSPNGRSTPVLSHQVVAMYAYQSDKPHSLSLQPGDVITVVSKLPSGWWEGVNGRNQRGWFPSNFTRAMTSTSATPGSAAGNATAESRSRSHSHASSHHSQTQQAPVSSQASQISHTSQESQPSQASQGSQSTPPQSQSSQPQSPFSRRSDALDPFASPLHPGLSPAINNGIMTFEISETEHSDDTPRLPNREFDIDSLSASGLSLRDDAASLVSRNGSTASCVSHDRQSSHGTFTSATAQPTRAGTHFLNNYAIYDTADDSYRHRPSHWIAQIDENGKLCYVNPERRHVTSGLPFEPVDLSEKSVPTTVTVAQEIVDQPDVLPATDISDSDVCTRQKSSVASIDSRTSSFSNTITIQGLENQTWTSLLALLRTRVNTLLETFNKWDEPSLVSKYNDVAQIVQSVHVIAGIPIGALPAISETEISTVFRSSMTNLSKIGLLCDIFSIKRRPSLSSSASISTSDSEQGQFVVEKFTEMTSALVADTESFVAQYKKLAASASENSEHSGDGDDDWFEFPSPSSLYRVRKYKGGSWVDTMVMNNGLPAEDTTTSRQGSVSAGSVSSCGGLGISAPTPVTRHTLFQLESYDASVPVDQGSMSTMHDYAASAKTYVDRILNYISAPPQQEPWSIETVKGRKKFIASNLHGLNSRLITLFHLLESLDLSIYYGGQRRQMIRRSSKLFPAKEAFAALNLLYNFMDAKQGVFKGVMRAHEGFRRTDASNADFIAALSMQFDQAKIEELYSNFEKSIEDTIKNDMTALGESISSVIGVTSNLVEEQKAFAARPVQWETDQYGRRGSGMGSASTGTGRQQSVATEGTSSVSTGREDQPWFLQLEHGDEMVYDRRGAPRGGTIRALVEQLTLHDKLRPDFNTAMLLTFRSFTDASELFDLLVDRFSIQPPEGLTAEEFQQWTEKKQVPIRIRVVNILKQWLETYWLEDDIIEDIGSISGPSSSTRTVGSSFLSMSSSTTHSSQSRNILLDSMLKFANQLSAQKFPGASTLINLIEQRMRNKEPSFKRMIKTNPAPKPAPVLPKSLKKFRLFDLDPLELARQLSLREFKLFVVITAQECLNRCVSRKVSLPSGHSNQIGRFIRNSNQLTSWVSWSILSFPDPKKRAQAIKYFVDTAIHCRAMNNFSSMTAVISGLHSSTIHRMKKTWELVSPKVRSKLDSMNQLMTSSRNFNEYRDLLSSVQLPAVPFFGVYLTDLTFTEDGNPDFLQNDFRVINFAKRAKAASTIENIRQFQRMPYNFEEIEEIQTFLEDGFENAPPIEEQYDTSLSIEPREKGASTDKGEKVAKLLEENGIL
uniref:ARAD1C23078p n=1 Tax=Blastobotrys adeninivorans TaxID=409370 RepID=A0A060T6U2_BLAAD